MYKMKAGGVVFYDPSSEDVSLQVLAPRAKYELNKPGSLEFTLLPGNKAYNSLQKMKTIVTLEQDGEVIFRGRVLETTTDLYNQKNVYCEGEMGYLLDSLVRPYEFEGTAPELFQKLVAEHNAQVDSFKHFQVGTITAVDSSDEVKTESEAYASTLSEMKQMLIGPYGGYLRVRMVGSTRYLDYIKDYTGSSGQAVEFGVNLVDIEDKLDAADVFSVLVPLGGYTRRKVTKEDFDKPGDTGDGESEDTESGETENPDEPETEGGTEEPGETEGSGDTGSAEETEENNIGPINIKSVNGGIDYLVDSAALAKYGRIVKSYKWEDLTDPQEVLEKGREHFTKMKEARTLTLNAVDLHVINTSVDSIRFGDNVRLTSSPHGLSMTDVCSALDLDIENPDLSEYTFGIPQETLTDNNANEARRNKYDMSHMHRWLQETDTGFNVFIEHANELNGRLSQVEFDMDAAKAEILLRAYQTEVNDLAERMSNAEIRIDGAEAAILLKADQVVVDALNDRVSSAEVKVDALEAEIKLIATESTINALGERITAAEMRLDGAEAAILLKADLSVVTDIGTRVSSAEVKIDAVEANVSLWAGKLDEFGNRLDGAEIVIDGLEEQIELNADNIAANAEKIKLNADNIEANAKNIQLNADNIEANAKNIALNAEKIQANADDIELNAKNIELNADKIALNAKEITANAQLISLKASKTDVNALGNRVSQAEILIDGANAKIELKASQSEVNGLNERLSQAEIDIDGANAAITLKASQSEVDGLDERLSQAEIDIDGANAAITLKASQKTVDEMGERISSAEIRIDGVESEIALKADTILLEGYVKASDLETEVLTILEYAWADSVDVQSLVAGSVNTNTLSSDSITTDSLSVGGEQVATESHSHSVSVGSDGTITLGEVSSTGGSFKIADTKYYKDGVSAARTDGINSVTLTVSGWQGGRNTVTASNGKSEAISLPSFSTSGGDTWSNNKTTVYFYTGSVSGPLASKEVDASSVYSAGANAGFNGGYNMAITGAMIELDGSTVKVYSPDGGIAGPTLDISSNLTASYNSGYSDATPVHASHVASYNSADNEYALQVTVLSDDGTRHVFDMTEIDASAAYDAGYAAGYQAAKDAATVEAGVSWSNPAQNYAMVRYWASAKIDGEEVAYTSASESKNISGYV